MDPKSYKSIVYQIIGAAMTVHNEMSWGLLEPVYNEALHIELQFRGIESEREKTLPCFYKGHLMEKRYQMDLVVEGEIVVELKSVRKIVSPHRAQLFNYLRLTKKPIGLLINFGTPHLQGERYAYHEDTNECVLLDKDMNSVFADSYTEDEEEDIYE